MEKRKLAKFLTSFVENTHSEQEHQEFINWLNTVPDNELPEILDEITTFFKNHPDSHSAGFDDLYLAIEKKADFIDKKDKSISHRYPLFTRIIKGMAALAVVAVGLLLYKQNHYKPDAQTAANVKAVKPILPGRNQAFLTLSGGNTIVLENVPVGRLAVDHGIEINKTASGAVQLMETAYNDFSTGNIKIHVPKGGQYKVILTDGTSVWLNASTNLQLPLHFSNLERRVQLNGEGYFEVTKNKLKPFKVDARDAQIQVYGTHFNVSAYDDEDAVKTSLLEGRVSIKKGQISKFLKPGQQAIVHNKIVVNEVNVAETIAWKNGNFNFAHEDVRTIMRKIARWYDVEVNYEGAVTRQGFFGTIPRSSDITDVLNMLELTRTVHFKIKERRLIVMK